MDVERIREQYRQSGMVGRVGFGTMPAIVVVDFINGLTDPRYPLGAGMDAEVLATRRLLDAGRAAGVLIVFIFGTPLASILTAAGVDTCIIAGCVTSGCVRATACDAMQHGFRAILPVECVADRAPEPHLANLLDMDSKIADVVSLEETMAYLAALAAKPERAPTVARR